MRLLKTCAVLLLAAACSNVPELEEGITPDLRRVDYPELVPIDALIAPLPAPAGQSGEIQAELDARAARLKARAQALEAQTN